MKEPTDHLRRYGEEIASAVSPARSRVAAMRAIGGARRTETRLRAPQFAFGAVGVLLVANVVTAGVANAAVPGDLLYPIDRGYETALDFVGLAGDHSEERIDEAAVLVDRGDLTGATDLVAEATDSASVVDAATSLQAGDPPDSSFVDSVQALVASARNLVAARETGEATRVAEAEAALDLAALRLSDSARPAHSGDTGPPSHAGEPGPPDHARDDENPGRDDTPTAPGPPGLSEDPPRQPQDAPGQDGDPPRQREDPPRPSEDPPGEPGNQGPVEDPPGQSGSPAPPDAPSDQPRGSGGPPGR